MSTRKKKKGSFSKKVPPLREAIAGRIRTVRQHLRLSQLDMAKDCGRANNNAISRLEKGISPTIHFDVLDALGQLAARAGLTREWLMTGNLISPDMSEQDLRLAIAGRDAIQILTEHGLDEIVPYVRSSIDQRRPDGQPPQAVPKSAAQAAPVAPPPDAAGGEAPYAVTALIEPGFQTVGPEQLPDDWRGRYVPILGRLAAGEGIDTTEAEQEEPGWASSYIIYGGAPAAAFAVRIAGDSMSPDYLDGDIVIVDPAQPVRRGICCVIWEADGDRRVALKKLTRRARKAILESINPDFAPIELAASQVSGAYRVTDHLPAIVDRAAPRRRGGKPAR
ncbi:MAG TPA: S24 family peptidase [Phycisphaerae bacterium]|nr:S24 family peptidase [Phycisphaerae bacterium]